MTILNQFATIQKSKMAQDLATSFLAGFASAALVIVLPDLNLADPGAMLVALYGDVISASWEYHFWNASFGAALGCAFGLRLKSAFDSEPALTIPIRPFFQTPPNSKLTPDKYDK